MIKRAPEQVAKRALILGTIAFRASLEVTEDPRVVEMSGSLVPWLLKHGCENELDPIERELLDTPYHQLSDSQRVDANWAGESAMFYGWALNLVGSLATSALCDQSILPELLFILRPEAVRILEAAAFRGSIQIEDMCRHVVLIHALLQESRVPGASAMIRQMHTDRLEKAGIAVPDDAIRRASRSVDVMSADELQIAPGLYFIRDHAALWLFDDRSTFFKAMAEDAHDDA